MRTVFVFANYALVCTTTTKSHIPSCGLKSLCFYNDCELIICATTTHLVLSGLGHQLFFRRILIGVYFCKEWLAFHFFMCQGGSRLMQILRGVWFRDNAGNLEPLDDDVVVDQLESQFLKLRSPSGISMQDLSTSTFVDPQNSSLRRYSSEKKRNLHSTTSAPVLYTVNDVDSEEVSRHYGSVDKQSLPHTGLSTGDTKKRIRKLFHTIASMLAYSLK